MVWKVSLPVERKCHYCNKLAHEIVVEFTLWNGTIIRFLCEEHRHFGKKLI